MSCVHMEPATPYMPSAPAWKQVIQRKGGPLPLSARKKERGGACGSRCPWALKEAGSMLGGGVVEVCLHSCVCWDGAGFMLLSRTSHAHEASRLLLHVAHPTGGRAGTPVLQRRRMRSTCGTCMRHACHMQPAGCTAWATGCHGMLPTA